jgi:hypothetical protein
MKKLLCILMLLMLALPFPSFAEASVISEGDTVIFGHYEQDADPDNGSEPLQWLVLEANDDSLLLITQYEIAYRPYSDMRDQLVSWADSDLRAWLNDAFLTCAFSEEERKAIAETPLHTAGGKRAWYRWGEKVEMTAPECDTIDRVFVLSSEETERYFYFGTTESNAASEHRLSMPSYSVLIRLALHGATHWEEVREIPNTDEYALLANRFLPVAVKTENEWTLPMPSVREYSQFWKDLEEFSPKEMWPWLLREQGKIYNCYWDGLGSMGFYDWYCWEPTSVRPALRVSRAALEQGMIIQPTKVYPFPARSELTGVWKTEASGHSEYWRFDEDGYHSTMSILESRTLFSVTLLYQAERRSLTLAQIGTQGQLLKGIYQIGGDTLILKIAEQEVILERANAAEWPEITE